MPKGKGKKAWLIWGTEKRLEYNDKQTRARSCSSVWRFYSKSNGKALAGYKAGNGEHDLLKESHGCVENEWKHRNQKAIAEVLGEEDGGLD